MVVRAADLCCGVGGMSYGLAQAGVDVRLGVDISAECQQPYEANVGADFRQQDLFDVPVRVLRQALRGEDARLLAACAPCQPFSEFNRNRARDRAGGEGLLGRVHELTASLKPELLVFENVPSVMRSPALAKFRKHLTRLGYAVHAGVVDAASVGTPQTRRRMVLFASRIGGLDPWTAPAGTEQASNVESAISDLPHLDAGGVDPRDPLHRAAALKPINQKRIRSSVPGGTWADWPRRLRLACHERDTGHSFKEAYGRMVWDRPAPTITTKFYNYGSGRFGHPEQDRAISAREAARLQGFPDDFVFADDEAGLRLTALGVLIGNAVPIPLAVALGFASMAVADGREAA